MKLSIICIFVLFNGLLRATCLEEKLTAEEFSWKLIENCLNYTKNTDNFVIAPYEAYQLYKELYNIEDESQENASPEGEDTDPGELILSPALPAIRKQRKLLNSKAKNLTDLLSSVSLTTRWSFNFQTRDTHKRVFHQLGKANQKIWVDFLRKDDTFHYSHDDQLNASILELPLNIKKIKLTLILPDQWDALPDLKEYLLENHQELNDLTKKTHRTILVRLLLPKFHLSYKKDLAKFYEKISAQELEQYDHVYQETNLEFNERGIGRFERTTVLFWNAYSYLRVSPEIFDINHPFLFLISDKNGIQFFGQVVKLQHEEFFSRLK